MKHQRTTGTIPLAKLQQPTAPQALLLSGKILWEDDVFLHPWDCTPDLPSLPAGEKQPRPFQWRACSLSFIPGSLKCCTDFLVAFSLPSLLLCTQEVTPFTR